MLSLMKLSGDPQNAFRTIHVTGTNGKGSTATMIARLLSVRPLLEPAPLVDHRADRSRRRGDLA